MMESRIPQERVQELMDKPVGKTTAQDVCDLTVRWYEHRALTGVGGSGRQDDALSRVVATYLQGAATAEDVALAAARWRRSFSDETWYLDGWEPLIIKAVDGRG